MSGFSVAISVWTALTCRFSLAALGFGYRPGNHCIFQKTTVRLFDPGEGGDCGQMLELRTMKATEAAATMPWLMTEAVDRRFRGAFKYVDTGWN